MKIRVRNKGKVSILDFSGKITIGEGDVMLRETFRDSLDAGRRLFIFNLQRVPFVDSAGIGEIIACHKRVRERNGCIKIVLDRKSKTRDVIVTTWLDRVFDLFDDEEEAIASFITEPAQE